MFIWSEDILLFIMLHKSFNFRKLVTALQQRTATPIFETSMIVCSFEVKALYSNTNMISIGDKATYSADADECGFWLYPGETRVFNIRTDLKDWYIDSTVVNEGAIFNCIVEVPEVKSVINTRINKAPEIDNERINQQPRT